MSARVVVDGERVLGDSLFVNDNTRFHMISPHKYGLVGSYLFVTYAKAHGRVIRSGKAHGRDQNFGTRIKAHKTGSFKDDSFFERMYPDETLLAHAVGQTWGCFQDLVPFMVLQ